MAHGTHDYVDDPRNERILICVNGELVPASGRSCRCSTRASSSATACGRACACAAGHPAFLEQHLDRLFEGAAAIMLDIGLTREELTEAIYATLGANDMTDGVHVRLMVTRGPKSHAVPGPARLGGPATVVIIAEHKEPLPATVERRHVAVHRARAPRRARTPSTRSSTRTASSTTSPPASRPTPPGRTRR